MLAETKLLVKRSYSLWWRDLNTVGFFEEENRNLFSNNISNKFVNGSPIEF